MASTVEGPAGMESSLRILREQKTKREQNQSQARPPPTLKRLIAWFRYLLVESLRHCRCSHRPCPSSSLHCAALSSMQVRAACVLWPFLPPNLQRGRFPPYCSKRLQTQKHLENAHGVPSDCHKTKFPSLGPQFKTSHVQSKRPLT